MARMGHRGGDRDQEACATYKKAKEQGAGEKRRVGAPKSSGDKVERAARFLMGSIVALGCNR